MDTHTSIIEEMSQVMEKLALVYLECRPLPINHHGEPCLHCRAYEVIERGRKLEDCVPLDEVMEVAR